MKASVYPQLIAVVGISAVIFFAHTRGFAEPAQPGSAAPALQAPAIVALAPIHRVQPRRDPFAASIDEVAPQQAPPPSIGTAELQLPSQDGHAEKSPTTDVKSGLHLRAVVLGSRRYALMADGAVTHIVTVGSPLAGSSVRSIALDGIVLVNGARFLPEESGNSK